MENSDRTKRELRREKQEIKAKGNRRARRILKRDLVENPEDAPDAELDRGRLTSSELNGLDRKRRD